MDQYLILAEGGVIKSVNSVDSPEEVIGKKNLRIHVLPGDGNLKLMTTLPAMGSVCVEKALADKALSSYREWGNFGPNGDAMKVFRIYEHGSYNYYISMIGNLMYPLPALTTDFVPFVNDKIGGSGKTFFIGIIRKFEPGKGKPAFIGGFREVRGSHFQTAIEALQMESFQEARLAVELPNIDGKEEYRNNPDMGGQEIKLGIGGKNITTHLDRIGTYQTGDEELIKDGEERRVHETTAYSCWAEMDKPLSERILSEMLIPGDDADKIFVWDTSKGIPSFGLSHHLQIYLDALEKYNITI